MSRRLIPSNLVPFLVNPVNNQLINVRTNRSAMKIKEIDRISYSFNPQLLLVALVASYQQLAVVIHEYRLSQETMNLLLVQGIKAERINAKRESRMALFAMAFYLSVLATQAQVGAAIVSYTGFNRILYARLLVFCKRLEQPEKQRHCFTQARVTTIHERTFQIC